MRWRVALADFARWTQSVGMDSKGGIAQCLAHTVQLPDSWRSVKLPPNAAANHEASIQQQADKIKSKVLPAPRIACRTVSLLTSVFRSTRWAPGWGSPSRRASRPPSSGGCRTTRGSLPAPSPRPLRCSACFPRPRSVLAQRPTRRTCRASWTPCSFRSPLGMMISGALALCEPYYCQ